MWCVGQHPAPSAGGRRRQPASRVDLVQLCPVPALLLGRDVIPNVKELATAAVAHPDHIAPGDVGARVPGSDVVTGGCCGVCLFPEWWSVAGWHR